MEYLNSFFSNFYILIILSGCFAYFLSKKIFTAIIYISKTKNLMDVPGNRSMHSKVTATLGGVGIFIIFSLTLIVFSILTQQSQQHLLKLMSLFFGIILLLFLGIKDDLLVLSPKKKLLGQILSSSIVVLLTDLRIKDFGGLFGIGEIHPVLSIVLSIFFIVFIINAFNLIDGIDGLAGSIAIIASITFGIYFVIYEDYLMASISCILIGSILRFLSYNLSANQKMFMGDSGSMFIGFLLAFQALSLLQINFSLKEVISFNSVFLVVFGILAFPIIDTIRVFFIRLKEGRSPFSADKKHIHHKLLELGLNHISATSMICFTSIVVIVASQFIDMLSLNVHLQLLLMVALVSFMYSFPFIILKRKQKIKLFYPRLAQLLF